MATPIMEQLPQVVSHDEWLVARKALLAQEKELTRARDRLNAERRRLPMVLVTKPYTFEGPDGQTRSLLDLFEGRQQLIVHHLMFHPDHAGPCWGCASTADTIGQLRMLRARHTTLVAVSRAPQAKLAAFHTRMGWTFPWYSSAGSDFNYDFYATADRRVAPVVQNLETEAERAQAGRKPWTEADNGSEVPAISAFLRVGDQIYHTYWTTARGLDGTLLDYKYLDLTALGRQENWEEPKGRAAALGIAEPEEGRYPDGSPDESG